jgi:phage FluMu protein Com
MLSDTIERYSKPVPDLQEKLAQSRAGAEKLELRQIKCPNCGFYLLDVYGRDHHYTRVKCRKCKFNEVIDTALFRTVRIRQYRNRHRRRRTRPYR